MTFYGYHGANPEERALGQTFQVDVEMELDLSVSGRSDRLEDTVNYAHVCRAIKEIVEGPPKNLIEALAESIAQHILSGFPVDAVLVRVKKPQVRIRGTVLASASVEVLRQRSPG